MPAVDPPSCRTVLVVCFGNLCRSPMAEALLRARLPRDAWRVTSAGTHAIGGDPPTEGAIDAVSRLAGLDISAQRSSPLVQFMLSEADHVLTMSRQQALETAALSPAAASKTRLLGAFAPATGKSAGPADPFGRRADALEIADPMGLDQAAYDACCERIVACADAATAWLLDESTTADPPSPVADWPEYA